MVLLGERELVAISRHHYFFGELKDVRNTSVSRLGYLAKLYPFGMS